MASVVDGVREKEIFLTIPNYTSKKGKFTTKIVVARKCHVIALFKLISS
jgi:hypothetical protein